MFTKAAPALLLAAFLATGCAGSGNPQASHADQAPWWEGAGSCRIWHAGERPPGRPPRPDAGSPNTRMSAPGDCRELQADLPDGAVLIGSD